MKLVAHGIAADLPSGWEGTIASERPDRVAAQMRAFGPVERAPEVLPVAHFATFGLPPARNDFGGDAVEHMGPDDVFVALLEYAREDASSALFSRRGLPRRLDPRRFSPRTLQRTIRGQSGLQVFFNEGGRAFCLYAVIGDAADAHRLVRRLEQVLATIEIEERT
ncbi:MAG TPA: hypothetical protein VK891_17310 [Euzebyales bacterium]|nr:hypothetical protein [Euzebyales bacterium]